MEKPYITLQLCGETHINEEERKDTYLCIHIQRCFYITIKTSHLPESLWIQFQCLNFILCTFHLRKKARLLKREENPPVFSTTNLILKEEEACGVAMLSSEILPVFHKVFKTRNLLRSKIQNQPCQQHRSESNTRCFVLK